MRRIFVERLKNNPWVIFLLYCIRRIVINIIRKKQLKYEFNNTQRLTHIDYCTPLSIP